MFAKNFKHIVLFIVGVVSVFTLISARQYFKVLPAHGSTSGNLIVFDDQLNQGFINWSWNSVINFNETSHIYSGAKAISFTPSAWGGLYFHTDSGINTTPYQALTFAAKAGTNGESFAVGVYDSNNKLLHSALSLDGYGGQPTSATWKVYNIPLHDMS